MPQKFNIKTLVPEQILCYLKRIATYSFDFQGESTDNFNWGVRRRPLSAGEAEVEGEADITVMSQAQDSVSEKTPLLTVKKLVITILIFNQNQFYLKKGDVRRKKVIFNNDAENNGKVSRG